MRSSNEHVNLPLPAYALSELQVACYGEDEDAEATLDGKFKGYCPIELKVMPGTLKLRVVKKVGAMRERVFEKEIRLGDDVRKKVEARLGGRSFRDCESRPEMVLIPPGSFMVGIVGSQQEKTVSQVFAAGKYEVMFAEWDACVADGGCDGHRPGDQGWGRGRQPVISQLGRCRAIRAMVVAKDWQ